LTKTKKALLITYYWPPSGGSGVQRWLYFAKYLPEFGIVPTVVTVDASKGSYAVVDESLCHEVSHISAYRTDTRELIKWYSLLKSGNTKKNIPQGNVGGKKPGLIDRIAAYIRGNYFIPDARIGWNKYALKQASKLIAQEHFDFIITTGPPHSTHLIGLELKKRFGIKWLADFRDPWSEVFYNDVFKRNQRSIKKDAQLEKAVLEEADLVLTVGPSMRQLLQSKLPGNESKVHFIFSGFDAEKLNKAQQFEQDRFSIAYVGTMGTGYPYETVKQALVHLNERSVQMDFILAGKIDPIVLKNLKEAENDHLRIIHKGHITHDEALGLMKGSNVLLLCLPFNTLSAIFVSGKLLEYIASGTPIAAIVDSESDAAVLIRDHQAGQVFAQNEAVELSNFIQKQLAINHTSLSPETISIFERKETTKQLAQLIEASF
jgi:glycosyltransferase involved in cell wall biosynthesis